MNAHSQKTRPVMVRSLSLSLLFAFKLASSYFESSSRFARTKEDSTHRARGRVDAVVARLGFVVARARWRFFSLGMGSPQNRVGEDARAYLAWDVAMFVDDFSRAM